MKKKVTKGLKRKSELLDKILDIKPINPEQFKKFLNLSDPATLMESLNEKEKYSLYNLSLQESSLISIKASDYTKEMIYQKQKDKYSQSQQTEDVEGVKQTPQIVTIPDPALVPQEKIPNEEKSFRKILIPKIDAAENQIVQNDQRKHESFNFTQLSKKINKKDYVFVPTSQFVPQNNRPRNSSYPLRNRFPPIKYWFESVERQSGSIVGMWTKPYK